MAAAAADGGGCEFAGGIARPVAATALETMAQQPLPGAQSHLVGATALGKMALPAAESHLVAATALGTMVR